MHGQMFCQMLPASPVDLTSALSIVAISGVYVANALRVAVEQRYRCQVQHIELAQQVFLAY